MGKKRILAVLLAACMIVESTAIVSASEMEASSVNTVKSEAAPAPEEAVVDDSQNAAEGGADSAADNEVETSGDETSNQLEGDAEKELPEDTERSPEETDSEEVQDPSEEEVGAENLEEIPDEEPEAETAVFNLPNAVPLSDGTIQPNGTDCEVDNLQIVRQSYGSIELSWNYKEITDFAWLRYYKIYRAETENGEYTLIHQTDDGEAYRQLSYEDNNVSRKDDKTAVNQTYYYKVSIVYQQEGHDEEGIYFNNGLWESALSAPVSNQDKYYGFSHALDSDIAQNYIGGCLVDESGNRLDSLTIQEGKPQTLQIARVKNNGTLEKVNEYCNAGLYLCDRYYTSQEIWDGACVGPVTLSHLGTDKVQFFPKSITPDASGNINDACQNMTALSGSANSDKTYYLVMVIGKYTMGQFVWQIPVTIEEGDGSYEPETPEGLYTSKEALCQAIRDTMVARDKETVLYATGGYEWWSKSGSNDYLNLDFEDVFDFHRERAGMKPYEGDYLSLAIGQADSIVYFGEWMKMEQATQVVNGAYLWQYTVTPSFITTKAQEEQVNQKIDQIIYQPGGELYGYQNASDYAKVKGAYEYVRKHVGYIGTTDPIRHTCYSALMEGKATCQGYALLFYRLVRELGIPCRVLMGTDANAHTYNIVRMDDGKWYYVDTNAGVLLKGTNEFKPATLQSQYRTAAFKTEYTNKIPAAAYAGGSKESSLTKVESLTNGELAIVDQNLFKADSMKAVYRIDKNTIKATGTVQYTEGCSGYLGYEPGKNMPTAGYFLALKLCVDSSIFTDDGCIIVSYPGADGTICEKSYSKTDLQDGSVSLLLNITNGNPNIQFTVDYDTENGITSKYDAKVYTLDISGVTKQSSSESSGKITEIAKYGIQLSSPLIQKSAEGRNINVTYEAVAYSDKLDISESGLNGCLDTKGNYIALQMDIPKSLLTTEMAKQIEVSIGNSKKQETGWDAANHYYLETVENSDGVIGAIRLMMPVTTNSQKQFTIKWGGSHSLAFVQNLTITVPATAVLEARNESALLPGSIAFNGLAGTMYVGQSQNVCVTFKKKYEADETQVYYTTNAPDVIMVNRITGVTKALKAGTAEITASAVDKEGKTIVTKAKVTVKALPAPTGVSIGLVKDHCVTVRWKANTTGQYTEVYAIPSNSTGFYVLDAKGKKADKKVVIEQAMQKAGLDGEMLTEASQSQKLESLAEAIGAGDEAVNPAGCVAASVPATENSVELKGLKPETEYVIYVRNASQTAASSAVFCGMAMSKTIRTTKPVFDRIVLNVKTADGNTVQSMGSVSIQGNNLPVYIVNSPEEAFFLSYTFYDGESVEMSSPQFTSVKYLSSNPKVAQVVIPKNAAEADSVKLGAQVGDTQIMVQGKDAAGVLRTSAAIIVRVVKEPAKLTAKTTTLTVGQRISIRELIGTDLKGSAEGMNLDNVDFGEALAAITQSNGFGVSYPDGKTDAQDAILTAQLAAFYEIPFKLKTEDSVEVKAKITVKNMKAASISKITVKDTSAVIEFTPSFEVAEANTSSDRLYGLNITDKVTGEPVSCGHTLKVSESGKTCIYEITGLSSNKAYEAKITTSFQPTKTEGLTMRCAVFSAAKKFTTTKQLLVSEGSVAVNYIDLAELRKDPDNAGRAVSYDAGSVVTLENNGTYVFMAQVSNLARTMETDKLKWAISSGDKKAASVKASASSFEMQLSTTKTGIFTVTATSTITKQPVATFTVEVIPYQSGAAGKTGIPQSTASDQAALLPEAEIAARFREKRENVA